MKCIYKNRRVSQSISLSYNQVRQCVFVLISCEVEGTSCDHTIDIQEQEPKGGGVKGWVGNQGR